MYTRDGGESSRKHPPNSCWPIAFLGSPGTRTSARAASRRRPCRSRRRCPCRSRRRRRLRQRARRRRSRAGYSAAATTSAACGRELLDFTVETNAPTAIYAPESATGVLVPGDRLRIEGGLGARGPFPPLFLALGVSVAFQCAKVENPPANISLLAWRPGCGLGASTKTTKKKWCLYALIGHFFLKRHQKK